MLEWRINFSLRDNCHTFSRDAEDRLAALLNIPFLFEK
jgi:hypothetical protein